MKDNRTIEDRDGELAELTARRQRLVGWSASGDFAAGFWDSDIEQIDARIARLRTLGGPQQGVKASRAGRDGEIAGLIAKRQRLVEWGASGDFAIGFWDSDIKLIDARIAELRTLGGPQQGVKDRPAPHRDRPAEPTATPPIDPAGWDSARLRRHGALRAKLAAIESLDRRMADEVKRRLASHHPCPYCGGSLGDQRHADHIYPVAKGGLSVDPNMVWVCATCNVKKSDMTLAQFIAKFQLDRAAIERRLAAQRKDF
jgi:5-methylcytosine-specific restriction endonuclease McrA